MNKKKKEARMPICIDDGGRCILYVAVHYICNR